VSPICPVYSVTHVPDCTEELERIVAQIRQRWPHVHILVRGDTAFAREEIMHWAEKRPGVDYVFGLAKNPRLERPLEGDHVLGEGAPCAHRQRGPRVR
jgi:hypothetical protein